ncbi:MAG TPA: ABC transporter permease [Candidatus Acidoferrales bacterium]|nr:ABC transporter permease [Candidatus Acidoferrales bacterium]
MKLSFWRNKKRNDDLAEEVQSHLDLAERDARDAGHSQGDARFAAHREFGNVPLTHQLTRDAWGWRWLTDLVQDALFALRMFRKSPGFTCAAILTLALGIGANTTIFSVINAVILRPLPYPSPDRIVAVEGAVPVKFLRQPYFGFAPSDWADRTQSFEQIAAYTSGETNLAGISAEPERIAAAEVTPNFFETIGLNPMAGRTFSPGEQVSGHASVAVLSFSLCSQLGSPRDVVGKTIFVNGKQTAVVGVMPEGFEFPGKTRLWLPFPWRFEDDVLIRQAIMFDAVGRLNRGVTASQARDELIAIESRPPGDLDRARQSVRVLSLHQQLIGSSAKTLWILLGAVGFVLLIACANVANLALARALNREREIALRAALGAGRARLVRQILTESVLLSALGALAGVLLATWGIRAALRLVPARMLFVQTISLDARVLLFLTLISLASGILFGLFPVVHALRTDLIEPLKQVSGARCASRIFLARSRTLLAISEIAIALVLVTGAGLLIRSFSRLINVNTGFLPERAYTAQLSLPSREYDKNGQRASFYRETARRISAFPGVTSAGYVSDLPFSRVPGIGFKLTLEKPTAAYQARSERIFTRIAEASPGYFPAIGIPLIQGRVFMDSDAAGAPAVAIVSKSLAEAFWPGENPLGKKIGAPGLKSSWAEIVGVVGDTKHGSLDEETVPSCYFPLLQEPVGGVSIVVRTSGNPQTVQAAVRRAIMEFDRTLPLSTFQSMSELLSESVAEPRFRTLLLGIFASLALALSTFGIYAVMSYRVAQRTREIGIRVALGADPRAVLRLVLQNSISITSAGIAIGLAASWGLTRLLASSLFEVNPHDFSTLAESSLLFSAVALLATYLPARRATRVDPLIALRHE